ncbi:leucine-rich repeat-containing G-protein coupled receptor 4-like [Diabrotica virgifera virgifera]|uniref:Leucine-rich repeat-containing G-protein coupled receptor 4-like n=1 Tax=Diabrotica virgifera virgifera TaxID=50390 RepID=A0A6P7HJ28_DIAVI|nr:leucine-rich repeat-containing G-protein coupled receptor 4-like [Diabrotica virgifera virgifera]
MNWYHFVIVLLLSIIKPSEETCEMLKKSINIYRVERVLYRYVTCKQLRIDQDDIGQQIKSSMNSSCEYLDISDSSLPIINKEMFSSLNLTQITIVAGVDVVDQSTFERVNISTITLENNTIRKIKDYAFKSFSIYVISLQNNLLTDVLQKTFAGAANLRKLNLNNNKISIIMPEAFKDLGSLEELKISSNKLVSLVQDIFYPLINIQSIDLSNNSLKDLEVDSFSKNKALQDLNLQRNGLAVLDAHFPSSLVQLNVEYNSITMFNISNLVKLTTVLLNCNKISNLKYALKNLPSLHYLHLNNNRIGNSSMVDLSVFSDLKNISIIELDHNNLDLNFDFKIFKTVATLEGVSFVGNRLQKLDFTGFPSELRVLNLSQNMLVEVKNLSIFTVLFKLDIRSNLLKEIDFDMLAGLNQLSELWLGSNMISKLTMGCFRSLKQLRTLDLSSNKISTIGAGVFNGLESITDLDLSNNQISYLNEDIFHNMKNLRVLSIAYNNLTSFNMKALISHVLWFREIDMNGNNWTCKLLIRISKENKPVHFVDGKSYNVSNVFGIPCRDNNITEGNYYSNYEEVLPDIVHGMNLSAENLESISLKLSYIIVFIIFLLVFLFAKFVVDKYSSQVTAAAQFIYQKSESEPELQLI